MSQLPPHTPSNGTQMVHILIGSRPSDNISCSHIDTNIICVAGILHLKNLCTPDIGVGFAGGGKWHLRDDDTRKMEAKRLIGNKSFMG